MRHLLPLTGTLVVAAVSLHGVELTLDRRAIEQALVLAASPFDEERSAFHGPYRLEI